MSGLFKLVRPVARAPTRLMQFALYSAQTGTKDHIDGLVKDKKIVVFMKGDREAPRCGFSNAVVQILKFHGVDKYDTHDVLEDDNLRQGIKDYSNWPTIPQVRVSVLLSDSCLLMNNFQKNVRILYYLLDCIYLKNTNVSFF